MSLLTKMEQKCKMGGGRLRNRHVVNEDRISELPEALLLHILSLLSTKEVIATSVLSKRWRSLWKLVPNLTFDTDDDKNMSSEDVYRSLILHKAPFLESLHLNIEHESGRLDIGLLIAIAFARSVRELVVDLYHDNEETVRFPNVLCSYNNTLEVLKLIYYVLLDFPCRVCFTSLRELHLYEVVFKDEESVCNLFSGCLSLKVLVVRRLSNWDVETYTIAVPSLQRLTIKEDSSSTDVSGGGYVINAPSLKYLNIKGLSFNDFCLIENAPELVEAKLNDVSNVTNENILASLTSAKSISLDLPLTIKCPSGSIFYQLVSLELCIDWWNLLSFMLENSPKLQNLKLIKEYRSGYGVSPVDWKWSEPKCVPDCLLLHLETFVWERYECEREDEKQVATYILKNATRLKKATISTKSIKREDLEKVEKRREMLNELASVVRSSTSCHLVVESPVMSWTSTKLFVFSTCEI